MKKLNVLHIVTIISAILYFMINGIIGGNTHVGFLIPYYPFLRFVAFFLFLLIIIYVIILIILKIKNRKNPKTYTWTKQSTLIVCIWIAIQLTLISIVSNTFANTLIEITTYSAQDTVIYNDIEYSIENYEIYEEDGVQYITFHIHMKNNSEYDHHLTFYDWKSETIKDGKSKTILSEFGGSKNTMTVATVPIDYETTKTTSFIVEDYDEMYLEFYDTFSGTNIPLFTFEIAK